MFVIHCPGIGIGTRGVKYMFEPTTLLSAREYFIDCFNSIYKFVFLYFCHLFAFNFFLTSALIFLRSLSWIMDNENMKPRSAPFNLCARPFRKLIRFCYFTWVKRNCGRAIAMAEDQYARYTAKFGYPPSRPDNLISFAKKHGVKITYMEANKLITKQKSGDSQNKKQIGRNTKSRPARRVCFCCT